jgi:hypothetical protein
VTVYGVAIVAIVTVFVTVVDNVVVWQWVEKKN